MPSAPSSGQSLLSGILPPSYQVSLSLSVVNSVPGKLKWVSFCIPNDRLGAAELLERSVVGAVSLRAVKTGSRIWIDISPIVPPPKSYQRRQLAG